ncbi:MAG: ABC transporter permease [Tidjanibacter sp.]|nr:ABC transporter permease [Tidjanibacter sp.]
MGTLGRVIMREVEQIARHPILWVTTLCVPLFSLLFMDTIFSSGGMNDLSIGVIDCDNTPTTRAITRTLDSSPTLHISHYYTSTSEALEGLRRCEIYGFVEFPERITEAMMMGTEATIPYYYHYALMSVGGEIAAALRTTLTLASIEPIAEVATALGVPTEHITTFLEPIGVDIHPLGNPTLNYHKWLTAPFFYIMFQIVVLLVTLYSVGSERTRGRGGEWLECARGDMLCALMGKLLPYTLSFFAVGLVAVWVLDKSVGLAGALWWHAVLTLLLITASQALAIFVYSLVLILGISMSFASMIGSLGATLSGVTFPLRSMYPIFDNLALALPVRHFMILSEGESWSSGWVHIVILLAFGLLPLITLRRLQHAIATPER